MDLHIHAFATEIRGVDLKPQGTLYLHTSPEFAMKKLMVAGMERLYQICHVYRNCEGSRLHSPEFTMLEWYRAGTDYTAVMEDCKGLLRACAQALGITHYRHKGMKCDPFAEWRTITVEQAFRQYAGLELRAYLPDKTKEFRAAIMEKGIRAAPDDSWDDLFFRVMAEKIEPFLGGDVPAILCDYPVGMASLSRKKPGDPEFAERFELYICGIELANAFSELTDAAEQRARFASEMAQKQAVYGETYPPDEDFFAALDYGLPESSGIALGVDRLVMLACGTEDIEDVLWTGKPGL
jgi:lysyl-tRNA synthetase class 2